VDIKPCRDKWKGSMTDRERFNNLMHYKPVDRCVNMEFGFWDENFTEWDIFVDNNVKHNGHADQFFNFDIMRQAGGRNWMHPGFEYKVIEETETTQIIQNGDGLTAEIPKDGHATIPHFIKASIVTPEDWKKVKEEKFNIDDPVRIVDVEKIKANHPPDRDYPLAIGAGSMIGKIRDILTVEGLAYACCDYPDMVEDMVETVCQLSENTLDQVLPHIDYDLATGWEDIASNSGPLVSKDFFYNVIVPRYKRIGKKLNAGGIDIWWTDCDGDVRELLPGFMEAGLNTMFPFEINGCEHPGALLDEYGKDLRIVGGVDKMQLRAGKEATKKYLESLVPYVERGGFIPHCDHRCPPDVTPENYIYYLDLKEKLFGL
jgi:hypothetical protein